MKEKDIKLTPIGTMLDLSYAVMRYDTVWSAEIYDMYEQWGYGENHYTVIMYRDGTEKHRTLFNEEGKDNLEAAKAVCA